jgi:hypothetical protein
MKTDLRDLNKARKMVASFATLQLLLSGERQMLQ